MQKIAVIATGGKQYVVSEGDLITVEKLSGEPKEGDVVTFDKVLLVDDGKEATLGTPYIEKAKVSGTLVEEGRAPKVTVIQFKSKSRYFKKKGHRQPYHKVKITSLK